MITFSIVEKINAPTDKIWNTISDFTIPAAPSFSVDVIKIGDSENNGIGTLRNITIGRNRFLERLVDVMILVGPSKKSYYQAFNSQKGPFFMLKHTFLTPKTAL